MKKMVLISLGIIALVNLAVIGKIVIAYKTRRFR